MLKDEGLTALANRANVAQFVSFGPGRELRQRFSRIVGHAADHRFDAPAEAIGVLLSCATAHSVNVRSDHPSRPEGREFHYGLRSVDQVLSLVRRLALQGLYTIVNETLDVDDGGVSGVVLGDVIEFAPGDTPRGVEQPGAASLPRALGIDLLQLAYGFAPALDYGFQKRVEFSLHPLRVGYRHEHTIVWQIGRDDPAGLRATIHWPNRFSRHVGDKAFGLLIAHLLGLPVPQATVIARAIAPFRFGRPTGTGEVWVRTCPAEQVPGRFTTQHGWRDPFVLLQDEDPEGKVISSVLVQEGVEAAYSGATLPKSSIQTEIEGVAGYGDRFMQGQQIPVSLPVEVTRAVEALVDRASAALGHVRMEWAYDGTTAWILQLHCWSEFIAPGVISPGETDRWRRFDPSDGLDALRELITAVRRTGEGVEMTQRVGITSHVGDLLRKAGVPGRIAVVEQPDRKRRVLVVDDGAGDADGDAVR